LLAALFSAAYVVLIGAVIEAGGSRPGLNLAAVAANAAAAWMALAGFTGLFLRLAGGPSPTWRYLSDSAYWLYLVHPPILVALQGVLMGVPVPSPLKAAIVAAAACPILFASYQLGVRHTLIGRWLNGPRQRGRVSIGSEAPPV
jgi:peptidoglycan/LPS O-acetylase OafA/YrhL